MKAPRPSLQQANSNEQSLYYCFCQKIVWCWAVLSTWHFVNYSRAFAQLNILLCGTKKTRFIHKFVKLIIYKIPRSQNGKFSAWWNACLTKCLVAEMIVWWNNHLMKCSFDKMTDWMMKWPVKMTSWWNKQITIWQNDRLMKIIFDKMTDWWNNLLMI